MEQAFAQTIDNCPEVDCNKVVASGEEIVVKIVDEIEAIAGSGYLGAVVVFAALFMFTILAYILFSTLLDDQRLMRVSRTLRWFMVAAAFLTIIAGILSIAEQVIDPVVEVVIDSSPVRYDTDRYGVMRIKHPGEAIIELGEEGVKFQVKERENIQIVFEEIKEKIDLLHQEMDKLRARSGDLVEPEGLPKTLVEQESGL